MKDVSKQKGDQIAINIAAGGPVAAGKNISQTTVIYQNTESKRLSWFQSMTLPFWVGRMWKNYCKHLAHTLSEQEGVDREFSELMAILSPADLPIRYQDKEYLLSEVVDDLKLPRLIILGEPGSGKSTSIRHLAMTEAHKASRDIQKTKIPILAPLDTYTGGNLLEFLQDKVVGFKNGQLSLLLPRYLGEGRMIIFFDALNEMPGDQFLKNVRLILKAIDDYPRNRFVFACRTEQYKGELKIPRAILQPLDDALIKDFIEGYLGLSGTDFFNRLQNESLLPLVRNPFFLWMVLRIGEVPKSKGDLIEQFINTLFEREEGKGSVYRQFLQYPSSELRRMLQYLAFQMMMKYRTTVISREETDALIRDFTTPKENSDFIQQGCDALILRFSDSRKRNFSFWHQIIQEYFAAAYLDKQLKNLSDPEIENLISDPWWWETLFIWIGICENAVLLISKVLGEKFDPKRVIFANALFYNSGNTDVEPYKDKLIKAMGRLLKEGLSNDDSNLILNLSKLVGPRFFFAPCQSYLQSLGQGTAPKGLERKFSELLWDTPKKFKKAPKNLLAIVKLAGKLGGQDAVRVLFQIHELDEHQHFPLEAEVLDGLAKIGKPAVLPVLSLIYLQESILLPASFDLEIPNILKKTEIDANICFKIIGQIGEPAIEVLEAQLIEYPHNKPVLLTILKALGHTPETPRSCQILAQRLGNEDSEIDKQAIQSLQAIAQVHAMPFLNDILKEKNLLRKVAAVDVLGQLNSIQAAELLEKAAKDSSEVVRSMALFFLKPKEGESSDRNRTEGHLFFRPIELIGSYVRSFNKSKSDVESEIRAGIRDADKEKASPRDKEKTTPGERGEMGFFDHMDEFRLVFLRSIIAYWAALIAIIISFESLALPALSWFYGLENVPAPSWYFYLPGAVNLAAILSFPYFVFEMWRFVVPGLYPKERKRYGNIVLLVFGSIVFLCASLFFISRYVVISLDLIEAPALRLYLINLLSMASVVSIGTYIIVRILKKNPILYNLLFTFVFFAFGEFAFILLGSERLKVFKHRLEEGLKGDLVEKFRKILKSDMINGQITIIILLVFIALPIHFYMPLILVSIFLIVISGNSRQAVEPMKNLGKTIRNFGGEKKALLEHILSLEKRIIASILFPVLASLIIVFLFYGEIVAQFSFAYKNGELFNYVDCFDDSNIRIKAFCAFYVFISSFIIPFLASQWFEKGLSSENKKVAQTIAFSIIAIPVLSLLIIYLISGYVGYNTEFAHVEITNKIAVSGSLILVNFIARYFLTVFGVLKTIRNLLSMLVVILIVIVWLWPVWFMALVLLSSCLYLALKYFKFRRKVKRTIRNYS